MGQILGYFIQCFYDGGGVALVGRLQRHRDHRARCHIHRVLLAPNYHLAFATPSCWILEYPTWEYPLIQELFVEPLRIEDGYAYPPTTPGLGIHLPDEVRKKYAYRGGLGAVMQRSA